MLINFNEEIFELFNFLKTISLNRELNYYKNFFKLNKYVKEIHSIEHNIYELVDNKEIKKTLKISAVLKWFKEMHNIEIKHELCHDINKDLRILTVEPDKTYNQDPDGLYIFYDYSNRTYSKQIIVRTNKNNEVLINE